jgi:hypothetical protein
MRLAFRQQNRSKMQLTEEQRGIVGIVSGRVIMGIVLLLSMGVGVASAQSMSLIPRATFGGYPQPFLDACLNMSQWPTSGAVTNSLGSFSGDLAAGDDPSLASCFSNMRAAGLELSIEAAAYQPTGCGTGQQCFDSIQPLLNHLRNDLGAPTIRIRMQEPLTDARQEGANQGDAINNTVVFMANIRNNYPEMRITSVEAYPYNSASLLTWWIGTLNGVSQSSGVQPPDAFELDHDIRLSGTGSGTWADIGWMQNTARASGWQFNVIFCATIAEPRLDSEFYSAVMERGLAYQQAGFTNGIDNFVIESWEHATPSQTVSEWDAYTFMYDAAAFRNAGYFPR